MTRTLIAALLTSLATTAVAEDFATTYAFDGSFDDATFLVEDSIINHGLVVDWVSHTGEMLARTGADLGADTVLFENADIFQFCSATISRQMMEADPLNIAHCPYAIFVFEKDGEVTVGFRNQPEGVMQAVQELLDDIAREAVGDY